MNALCIYRLIILFAALFLAIPETSHAQGSTPKRITGWKVSCGVDQGALQKSGKTYVFRPSSNRCDGHTKWGWKQRTEIISSNYSASLRGRYLFESTVAMQAGSSQKFDLFQMHDARRACAPPLKVEWSERNQIRLKGHYKVRGKGEEHCIQVDFRERNYQSGQTFPRDGRPRKLQVVLDFDGQGGFNVLVAVDGSRAIEGTYDPDFRPTRATSVYGIAIAAPKFQRPRLFGFKHGVYAEKPFDFVLVSENMRMVRLSD